jgi:hypothetical protein
MRLAPKPEAHNRHEWMALIVLDKHFVLLGERRSEHDQNFRREGDAMRNQFVTRVIGVVSLLAIGGCASMHETRMAAATNYSAPKHVYVVPTPTPLLAGPDTVRTYSPDGSTVFVCPDGSARDATKAPGDKPACL